LDDDDLDQVLFEALHREIEAARSKFERAAFNAALDATPELNTILVRVLRKELTGPEAKKLAAPHIARLRERYLEIIKTRSSDSN